MEVAAFERLEEKIDSLLTRLQETREENQRLRDQLQEREAQVAELSQKVEGHQQAMDTALADNGNSYSEKRTERASLINLDTEFCTRIIWGRVRIRE